MKFSMWTTPRKKGQFCIMFSHCSTTVSEITAAQSNCREQKKYINNANNAHKICKG